MSTMCARALRISCCRVTWYEFRVRFLCSGLMAGSKKLLSQGVDCSWSSEIWEENGMDDL